jgi:hypothetical protein
MAHFVPNRCHTPEGVALVLHVGPLSYPTAGRGHPGSIPTSAA